MITVACPLCQVNLDERQPEMAEEMGFTMPILYITQLMAWSFGLGAKEQSLKHCTIAPQQLQAS